MYETFEHTADLGLRVQAGDLNALFEQAGLGLFSILVDNADDADDAHSSDAPRTTSQQEIRFQISGTDYDYLLLDWLNELLYRFDAEQLLLREFTVTIEGTELRAIARAEPIDSARHHLSHEVKAITYHGLKVERVTDGWVAEVIVDI